MDIQKKVSQHTNPEQKRKYILELTSTHTRARTHTHTHTQSLRCSVKKCLIDRKVSLQCYQPNICLLSLFQPGHLTYLNNRMIDGSINQTDSRLN